VDGSQSAERFFLRFEPRALRFCLFFKYFSLFGIGHELHEFNAYAIGVGNEVLAAFASSCANFGGVYVKTSGFKVGEGGFDIVYPKTQMFESLSVCGLLYCVFAIGEYFNEVTVTG
jgi:hypothetical protein